MKETPILFSAPMVRAILAGTKTQTRREFKARNGGLWPNINDRPGMKQLLRECKYGHPGDRIWVRESFKAVASGEVKNGYGEVRYGFAYQADGATRWQDRPTEIHDLSGQVSIGPMQFKSVPWKPSIHMPRRASRILLEIVSVRVERLQDISDHDAFAEGVEKSSYGCHKHAPGGSGCMTGRDGYRALWESINGPGSWAANPWVWVVEFNRVRP